MQKTTAPGSSSGNFVDKAECVAGTKIIAADQQAHPDDETRPTNYTVRIWRRTA